MINKNLCIIQARMGSTRLPGKVLMKVGNVALLEYQIKRVQLAKKIDKIVVATGTNEANDKIEKLCQKIGVDCFRGSENDVLGRYYHCFLKYPHFNNIVRITGDCPLIDPRVVDQVINFFEENNYDFVSNALVGKETFPDGLDVEVFNSKALRQAATSAKLGSEREHVTLYLENNKKIKKGIFKNAIDWSHFRLTVDNKEDFLVVKFLIEHSRLTDDYLHYISLLTKNPEIMTLNSHIKRNEGFIKSLKNDFKIN